MNNTIRNLEQRERQIIDLLLSANFPGKHELKQQLKDCTVKVLDDEGSLEFFVKSSPKSKVIRRIPIEAQVMDKDGIFIHILLHVVNGFVKELEFYKENGDPIVQPIDIHKIELVQLP